MGFVRRYGVFPPREVITLIEGVIIADLAQPGQVQGVGTGVVGLVGEFPDMSYATRVSSAGVVSTDLQPVEVFGPIDLVQKVGGWDSSLGAFGGACGNGWAALRNKRFARLILQPINLASAQAARVWRQLPTNVSGTSAVPITPVTPGEVSAGREFRTSGGIIVHLAKRFVFTSLGVRVARLDGATSSTDGGGLPAATRVITTAAGLTAANVAVGDLVVPGSLALGAGTQNGGCALAGTLRVTAFTDTTLTVQKLDGTNFEVGEWVTGAALAFRVHPPSDGDSGVGALASAAAVTLPVRPLTDNTGSESGSTAITAGTQLPPATVPPAATQYAWDPLSGLRMALHPSTATAYDPATQRRNIAGSALDTHYLAAIDAFLTDAYPARDIRIVTCARRTTNIALKERGHVLDATARGLTRSCVVAPDLSIGATSEAVSDTAPGVGAFRSERVFYTWPGARHLVPEAVGTDITGADGVTYDDGILDEPFNTWLASLLSMLAPELNPGQSTDPVPLAFNPVISTQRGLDAPLSMPDYITLRARGVAGLRMDNDLGPVIQSGITSSLTAGEKNISRRRMDDFITDSLAVALKPYNKRLVSQALRDAALATCDAFLAQLLSVDNPAAQRIAGYTLDDQSANTDESLAAGIYIILVNVRLLATADFIVLQATIGENVDLSVTRVAA